MDQQLKNMMAEDFKKRMQVKFEASNIENMQLAERSCFTHCSPSILKHHIQARRLQSHNPCVLCNLKVCCNVPTRTQKQSDYLIQERDGFLENVLLSKLRRLGEMPCEYFSGAYSFSQSGVFTISYNEIQLYKSKSHSPKSQQFYSKKIIYQAFVHRYSFIIKE